MTSFIQVDKWMICAKCTGLLPAVDAQHVNEHIESCNGNVQESPCTQFAVNKDLLLEIMTRGKDNDGKKVTRKKKAKRRKREDIDSDDFVPVEVKREKVDEEESDSIRRSKRTPKPKKFDDSLDSNSRAKKQQNPIAIDDDLNTSSCNDNDIGEVQVDPVTAMTSAAVEAMISAHPKAEFLGSDDLVVEKMEEEANENQSPKQKYGEWKQQLSDEYAEYRDQLTDDKGVTHVGYRCPKCTTRTFPAKHVGMFHRHVRTCKPSGSDELRCQEPNCSFVAKDAKRFSEHKRYHLQPYMCEFCPRRFADKRNMLEHRLTHTDEKPLSCEHCDYRARNKRLLKEHQRKHTGEFLHCPEPGCGFYTPYQGSLTSHIDMRHREHVKHRCDYCGYVTNSLANMKRHRVSHQDNSGVAQQQQQDKFYQCSLCDYKAISKYSVVSHLRSHTKEKIFFCNKCDYSASYPSAFRVHMMTHYGLKTWQCGPCGYNSNTRAKVFRHIQNKHPDANAESSVVNLGLSVKLELSKYRRPGDTNNYIVQEVVAEETEEEENGYTNETVITLEQGDQIIEQLEDVGGEEIVVSEDLIADNGREIIVMTEDGEVIIPAADLNNTVTLHVAEVE